MKNGFVFFLGLFAALAISWAGIVLGSHAQLGALAPYFDDAEGRSFPERTTGIAARGQLVYADLGCASCHTQAVRRPDFGGDQARGWGERQSVARDYIHQARVQLGASRVGPDLTNLGSRKPPYDAEDLLKVFYTGLVPHPEGPAPHPSYKFLFDDREIVGERSASALKLPAVASGRQIVPSERAQSLVAYLLSLNNAYDYPESRPMPRAVEKAAAGHDAKAAPANKEGAHK